MEWEDVYDYEYCGMRRAAVPGGWFISIWRCTDGGAATWTSFFYPDPEHVWDGKNVDLREEGEPS